MGPILAGTADVTGLDVPVFLEAGPGRFWTCDVPDDYVLFRKVSGGTLCFRRDAWVRSGGYPDGSIGEDVLFLRRAVEQARFFAGSPRAVERLTISLGAAMFGSDGAFRQQLIENADAALYAAKNQGRNRVVLYSELKKEREREAG